MAADERRPIIIRRKKTIAAAGHHGGAWKVAYADFVTAMMAFFLLMWLLNATNADQKKGLADYFDSRVPLVNAAAGGEGLFRGDAMRAARDLAEEAAAAPPRPAEERAGGGGAPKGKAGAPAAPPPGETARDEQAFAAIHEALEALSGESDVADPVMRHIRTRVTDEGFVIDLFETEDRPLFPSGSAEPTEMLRALVAMVASVAALVTNEVAVTGHTDATPFVLGGDDGNWALSADRAQATRRLLVEAGLDAGRLARVTGRAATQPMIEENPRDPRNRRVEIVLLRAVG